MYRGWNVFRWSDEGFGKGVWNEESPIFFKNENTGECILSQWRKDVGGDRFCNTEAEINKSCGVVNDWEEQRRYQMFLWLRNGDVETVEVVIIESSGLCLTPLYDGKVVFRLCDVSDGQTWLMDVRDESPSSILLIRNRKVA
eukprot:GHVN01103977.1.p1 GENE.GHVN01103977.1~~GHVN01103977.1.p1  ORF type:complete len:142 (-),score=22.93 GHVN01103977.1:56-481(-)